MNKQIRERFNRLQHYADKLALKVKDTLPQMEEVLRGRVDLPKNCPSNEVAAAFLLRDIEKPFREVAGAIEDIKKSIRDEPGLN